MTSHPVEQIDLEHAASRLAGEAIVGLQTAGKGANSRTFRITTSTRTLALKCYPHRAEDQRDRLEIEWKALTFLRDQGLDAVPLAMARDDTRRLLLMEWLEGPPVTDHSPADLEAAINFMTAIFYASDIPQANEFPPASEACLSTAHIVSQINERRAAFSSLPTLDRFLVQEFDPRFRSVCTALSAEINERQDIHPRLRRLIPADFGFHNAIRGPSNRLRFIDFDYFGWDDPVKLTADFLLHPAMLLSVSDKKRITTRLAAALPHDDGFLRRLESLTPLYALRWALILLNPFRLDRLPERPTDDDAMTSLLHGQIKKAKRMCEVAVV